MLAILTPWEFFSPEPKGQGVGGGQHVWASFTVFILSGQNCHKCVRQIHPKNTSLPHLLQMYYPSQKLVCLTCCNICNFLRKHFLADYVEKYYSHYWHFLNLTDRASEVAVIFCKFIKILLLQG